MGFGYSIDIFQVFGIQIGFRELLKRANECMGSNTEFEVISPVKRLRLSMQHQKLNLRRENVRDIFGIQRKEGEIVRVI